MRSQRGFTLVEMIVVLAIIGVFATMAMSLGSENKATARAYAATVVAELDAARSRSVSTRRWHRLNFALGGGGATLQAANWTGMTLPTVDTDWTDVGGFTSPKHTQLVALTLSADLTPLGTTPGQDAGFGDKILFGPDGSSKARTLYLSDGGANKFRVVVFGATGTGKAIEGW